MFNIFVFDLGAQKDIEHVLLNIFIVTIFGAE
jgi:hypothetical protein